MRQHLALQDRAASGQRVILAHLNGGPRDDVLACLANGQERFYVQHPPRPWTNVGQPLQETATTTEERTGWYESRLDGNGERVPHNLAGAVEYDWQGWT